MVIIKYLVMSLLLIATCSAEGSNKTECSESAETYYAQFITTAYITEDNRSIVSDGMKNIIDIKANIYKDKYIEILNPTYRIKCINIYKEEGNVQDKKYSYFYGFGLERNYIKVLQVFDKTRSIKYPRVFFEIISTEELWELDNTNIQVLHRSNK